MQPTKTIFDRLYNQRNQKVVVNGNGGVNGKDVPPPFYPDLPEYPCKLIRNADNKVVEIRYGNDSQKGYVWRQFIHRSSTTGKVDYIEQENPDGKFHIVLNRNSDDKVEVITIE
jgi:hypothetical protein